MPTSVIVAGARTPTGRLMGSLKTLSGADLGALAITGALEKSGVDAAAVQYVIMGQVLTAGAGQMPASPVSNRSSWPTSSFDPARSTPSSPGAWSR
jgi:acetyl-CoA C-acetyltransferase